MEYKEDQLTEWFDIEKQKPWEPGVYLVFMEYGVERYSFFDGKRFNYVISPDSIDPIKYAFNTRKEKGAGSAVKKWRGLNFNPSKPKKQGNKRKTMYVVMAQNKKTLDAECDGAFAKKENAEARKQSALKIAGDTHRVWIQKIRFRTPEA